MSTSRQSAGSPCLLKILLDEIAPETSPGPAFRNSGTPSGHIKPQSAASRKLTARALEIYLGHKPSPEVLSGLARTPQGKPYFPGYPDFKYNISHSGRYAVCGMICGGRDPQPVGIDIDCGSFLLGAGKRVPPRTCPRRGQHVCPSPVLPLLDSQGELYKTDWTRAG